jgi:hypothetical protein
MKNKMLKTAAILAAVALILGTILGWGYARKATVTSEPLPCMQMGATLVCFDGHPEGNIFCEMADEGTVLCSPEK